MKGAISTAIESGIAIAVSIRAPHTGSLILVDRSQTRRCDGAIYMLRNKDDGVIIKRLTKTGWRWQVRSDHPARPDRSWLTDTEVIGQVRWMAHDLFT